MAQKLSSLKKINRRYHSSIKAMTRGAREKEILDSLSNGKNSYLRLDRVESSAFDKTWIEEIEDVIFDLGEIIANPRQVTKDEGNIVPIELAKKINAESVQHLASHTQYIKEIDDYGNVVPSKVLSIISDDDIRTYENRFIATFVRRLVLFIEKRYEIVSKFAELHDEEVLYFKNKSFVDGATVEIETKIKVSHKSDDELSLKSNAYVERIKQMREYILYFYSSEFMKKLKTEKDVHNPILQTNIIRKNPKYHHCYEVYKFLERYDHLGVNYKVDEHYSLFNEEELKELNRTLFANYITLKGKDRSKNAKTNTKVYKPKILTSMDDESFIYGPLLNGPIEFVRMDKGYQDYLESKLRKDLPLHPTKAEKEYYKDEYAAKNEFKQDQKQLNDLIKRTEKSVKEFNKKAEKIDKEREQARLDLLRQEQEIIKQEEEAMLAAARQELVDTSLKHKEKHEAEEARKEKEFLASIKPAKLPVEMSHPASEPVSYDEAVADIWPQSLKETEHQYDDGNVEVMTYQEALGIKPAVVPVEMSHPHTKPVTYEEAVKEIWPQTKHRGRPAKRPRMEAYPTPVYLVDEEAKQEPVEDIKPAIVPVEMSHPKSKPVSYDEACKEIWPALSKKPAKAKKVVVKPVPAPVVKEPVKKEVKEEPVEIKPAVVPTPMSHPHSDPVTYEQAVEQIWPNFVNAPALRKEPENKTPKKPSRAIKAQFKTSDGSIVTIYEKSGSKKEEATPKKFEPKPVVKAPKKEKPQPVKEEPKPVVEEKKPEPKAEPKPVKKIEPKKESIKKALVKPAPKKAEPKPAPKKEAPKKVEKQPEPERKKIPGKFIVKTNEGYYVSKGKYSILKEDAKVFDDFNLANDIKKEKGGKVVKL